MKHWIKTGMRLINLNFVEDIYFDKKDFIIFVNTTNSNFNFQFDDLAAAQSAYDEMIKLVDGVD